MRFVRTIVVTTIFLLIALCISVILPSLDFSSPEPNAQADTPQLYQVVSVTDGDTFRVEIDDVVKTVRIVGIDTPETVDPRKPVQCFGKEASNYLKSTLHQKKVSLQADATQSNTDRYGRLLRFVFLEDGRDLGLHMIQEGFAQSVLYGSVPHEYWEAYQKAEVQAQKEEKGLWNPAACIIAPLPLPTPQVSLPEVREELPAEEWSCDCTKPCVQMTCDEAQFQLLQCNCAERDGNGDGLACNSQCAK